MNKGGLGLLVWCLVCSGPVAAQVPAREQQISEALAVLREQDRVGATVLGYDSPGAALQPILVGDGVFVCLADAPGDSELRVSCYHRSLEPFMARGRELAAEGVDPAERRRIRGEEIAAGDLEMPERALLMNAMGPRDPATGVPDTITVLRVIYLPFATTENTGIPDRPSGDNGPWIMDAGLHRAHVMLAPERRAFEPAPVGR